MKTIKTSKLISQENIAKSITVSPLQNGYEISYTLKEKNKSGYYKRKTVKVNNIIEDVELPVISNWTVAYLGYNTYKFFKTKSGFYINLYKF